MYYVHTYMYVVLSCGTPQSVENGVFDISRGMNYLSVAHYTCNEGYRLVGISIITCQLDQQWSGPSPTCLSK